MGTLDRARQVATAARAGDVPATRKLLLGKNWKSNLISVVAFISSVPQAYTAFEAWMHHQHPDWRGAIGSLVIAALAAVAKDGSNSSTSADVAAADAKAKTQ